MDAATASALLVLLRPWLSVMMRSSSLCALQNPARTELGVVFRFDCHPFEDDDERAVVMLREAIDLVYRALAVHSSFALLLAQQVYDGAWIRMAGCSDASVKRQLLRNAPFRMKITLGFEGLEDAVELKHKIADEFFVGLSNTPSADVAFLETRALLDALLEVKNPRWAEMLALNPIEIRCRVHTAPQLELDTHESDSFFAQLAAFTEVLDKQDGSTHEGQGQPSHLPLKVERVHFRLSQLPLTPAMATAISPMLEIQRVRINCNVMIDPRLVKCSRKDLSLFLRAIRAIEVALQPNDYGVEETLPMDSDIDITYLLRGLLTVIMECKTVDTISVGGLLALSSNPHSRYEIFQVLVDTVMSRAQPLSLILGVGQTGELDAQMFSGIARLWKTQNGDKKLRLKRLAVDVYDFSNAYVIFTASVIDDLDEVEELSITNHGSHLPHISTQLLFSIFKKFVTLRELSTYHVELDSMQVFCEHAPSTLESLSLVGLHLEDRQSFLQFADDLGEPERPLARQLRHLSITDFISILVPIHFRLREAEVERFVFALEANRVLETVRVVLGEQDPIDRMRQSQALSSTAGYVIHAPRKTCLSTEEKARKVAFLSVVRSLDVSEQRVLDMFLVREIFAFCEPYVLRSVEIS